MKKKWEDQISHLSRLEMVTKQDVIRVANKYFKNAQKTTLKIRKEASYIDKLEHNVKYYYTFRTIDYHRNPSLPSPVYQVELVENSGVVYPVVSIYQFEAQKLLDRVGWK